MLAGGGVAGTRVLLGFRALPICSWTPCRSSRVAAAATVFFPRDASQADSVSSSSIRVRRPQIPDRSCSAQFSAAGGGVGCATCAVPRTGNPRIALLSLFRVWRSVYGQQRVRCSSGPSGSSSRGTDSYLRVAARTAPRSGSLRKRDAARTPVILSSPHPARRGASRAPARHTAQVTSAAASSTPPPDQHARAAGRRRHRRFARTPPQPRGHPSFG